MEKREQAGGAKGKEGLQEGSETSRVVWFGKRRLKFELPGKEEHHGCEETRSR